MISALVAAVKNLKNAAVKHKAETKLNLIFAILKLSKK